MQMSELPKNDYDFELRVKRVMKDRQRLTLVEIRYVRTPDAYARLSRAIDVLLNSAATREATLAESINPKKEQAPHFVRLGQWRKQNEF